MSSCPVTLLNPPPAQDGEYLNTLEQWGELPEYLTIPNAARFIAHASRQNQHAIQKIIIKAILATPPLPFAGLKSNGEWEAGMFRLLIDIQGKPRLRPADDGIKFTLALADIGMLHVEAMGVKIPDVLELLVKRGRKIPEELRHMLPALDATPPTQENQAISAVDRNNSTGVVRRKRATLVKELVSIWPTIELDLSDSVRNGLNCAKLEQHAFWDLNKAVNWAVERGKITKQKAVQSIATVPDSAWAATLKQLFRI